MATIREMDGVATRATAQGASSVLTAGVTFVILTALAMVEYPGGSRYSPGSHHYLFFENFFSDLGVTKTYAGYTNTSSCVLFVIATSCVGISLIAFSGSWHGIAERRGIAVRAAWVFKWSAIASGLCFIGIGATPSNLLGSLHNFFARGAFGLLLVFVLSMLAVQRRNRWPLPYVITNVLFVAAIGRLRRHPRCRPERPHARRTRLPGHGPEAHGVRVDPDPGLSGVRGAQGGAAAAGGAPGRQSLSVTRATSG